MEMGQSWSLCGSGAKWSLLTRVLVAVIVGTGSWSWYGRRPQDYFINQGRKQASRGAGLDP